VGNAVNLNATDIQTAVKRLTGGGAAAFAL